MPDQNISVIIPAYNEEDSLPLVIANLPQDLIHEIIVVNNASTDSTAEVARSYGCRVVYEARRGYGQACLTGIEHLSTETDIVVFLDGDYSDHPEQIDRLIDPIINEDYHFVIGSRAKGECEEGAMMPQALYGNKLACFLMYLFWGARYSDLGPFRAIRKDALDLLEMNDRNFGWTIEMQIKAYTRGLQTREVPVDYRRRIGRSKISGTILGSIMAGEKILRTIFKYKFLTR